MQRSFYIYIYINKAGLFILPFSSCAFTHFIHVGFAGIPTPILHLSAFTQVLFHLCSMCLLPPKLEQRRNSGGTTYSASVHFTQHSGLETRCYRGRTTGCVNSASYTEKKEKKSPDLTASKHWHVVLIGWETSITKVLFIKVKQQTCRA